MPDPVIGYRIEPPGNPGGPSATTSICPVSERMGEFYNNTGQRACRNVAPCLLMRTPVTRNIMLAGHSNAVLGMRIYPRWTPKVDPCNPSSQPNPQVRS
jgi:hypothetical protein